MARRTAGPYVVVAGVLTTLMAIRPLGVVRILRRYAIAAVTIATIYLYVELLRNPLPSLTHGSWTGFWPGADYAIAAAVSFAPLASDYTRHARSSRSAFGGTMIGYTIAQSASYVLGLVAIATVVQAVRRSGQTAMFGAFIAVPVGWLALGVLVARELDQSFADSYSTVMSVQNVFPRFDRRILAVVVGGLATVLALALRIDDYANFLALLGSVFVPLTACPARRLLPPAQRSWDVTDHAPVTTGTAGAVDRGHRHLPAGQPRLRRLVGRPVDDGAGLAALHAAVVDERVGAVVRRGCFAHAALYGRPPARLVRRWGGYSHHRV